MAFPTFNNVSVIQGDVAAATKAASWTALVGGASFWGVIVPQQQQAAADLIYSRLIARGYTPAQIAAWDLGAEVERQISPYLCLVAGGMLEAVDAKLLEKFESYTKPKEGLLDTVLLTIGQQWYSPADTPGTVGSGNPSPGPCSQRHWSPEDYGMRF